MTRYAAMLAALSQPTRLRIVGVVAAGGADGTPAGEIARAVSCPPSTLSFHLKELTQAGLLAADPQGRFIRYSVVPAALLSLSDYVRALPGAARYGPVRSSTWRIAPATSHSSSGFPSTRPNNRTSVVNGRQRTMNVSTESSNICRHTTRRLRPADDGGCPCA